MRVIWPNTCTTHALCHHTQQLHSARPTKRNVHSRHHRSARRRTHRRFRQIGWVFSVDSNQNFPESPQNYPKRQQTTTSKNSSRRPSKCAPTPTVRTVISRWALRFVWPTARSSPAAMWKTPASVQPFAPNVTPFRMRSASDSAISPPSLWWHSRSVRSPHRAACVANRWPNSGAPRCACIWPSRRRVAWCAPRWVSCCRTRLSRRFCVTRMRRRWRSMRPIATRWCECLLPVVVVCNIYWLCYLCVDKKMLTLFIFGIKYAGLCALMLQKMITFIWLVGVLLCYVFIIMIIIVITIIISKLYNKSGKKSNHDANTVNISHTSYFIIVKPT